ncbi:CLPTM1 domain protein [Pseudovirgaria hyperparasitica]|uniref:CLPTM1 domain protein n=1 Tax=Pseudovirgaria hyperparasitica TaxID=470096 RepID=A0A6A6W2C9_9PEZI|nr:CLPTM1 domain protein [Pseudovirgaria hyperparasitica]KAF2755181.1 CLPTM1 domain protein [Pseudovirgaria hyperparasitica]
MPPQQQQQQAGAQREEGGSWYQGIIRNIGIFLLIQLGIRYFVGGGGQTTTAPATPGAKPGAITTWEDRPLEQRLDNYSPIPNMITPIWQAGIPLDIDIYISPSIVMTPLKNMPRGSLIMQEREFGYGNYSDTRTLDTTFDVPKEVQNNGTLFAHFYIAKSGSPLDPSAADYSFANAYNFVWPLTQMLPKKKVRKTRSLLSGSNETSEETPEEKTAPPTYASYYHPNFTMSFIPDSGTQSFTAMHPAVRGFIQQERSGQRDASGQNGWYYPILFVNTFWQLRDHMTELNSTVTTLPLHIDLQNQRNWIFSIMASIDAGMKQTQAKSAAGQTPATGDGSEFEEFKRILLDSNIYLLATTGIVSIFHMIFEMLAFKSDVSHWRNKKDNVGTSFRTILANVFMQTVIFLYLMDNNENTSWMILFGQGMGIAIEAWKITKTVNVRIRPTPDSLIPYSIVFENKHKLSETEKKTQEYDEIAFKYLYIIAVPLLLAYAGYSLVYDTHKSWYSFIIATLVGSVYAYGFLMMVPSLYINYRLKSVAHMPARAMTYKFLNTFIDDLFAFTIKMPTLHRLATLRDDVIFFVYLYQSWKYKVDYTRVNEFGQGGDEEDEEEKKAAKPLVASPNADSTTEIKGEVSSMREGEAVATGKAKGDAKRRK